MVTEEMMCQYLAELIEKVEKVTMRDFIKKWIPEHFKEDFTEEDLKLSETRKGEYMYEQRARNINSHKNFPKNVDYINQSFYKKKSEKP